VYVSETLSLRMKLFLYIRNTPGQVFLYKRFLYLNILCLSCEAELFKPLLVFEGYLIAESVFVQLNSVKCNLSKVFLLNVFGYGRNSAPLRDLTLRCINKK
jgi:hypothetical protein